MSRRLPAAPPGRDSQRIFFPRVALRSTRGYNPPPHPGRRFVARLNSHKASLAACRQCLGLPFTPSTGSKLPVAPDSELSRSQNRRMALNDENEEIEGFQRFRFAILFDTKGFHVDVLAKLAAMGLSLPTPPRPVAAYVPAVRSGNLIFVSGQLPMAEGKLAASGPVPSQASLETAQAGARQCALNALAIVGQEIGGDWSRLVRVVRLGVFVWTDATFTEQAKVANGASELLGQVLGEAGRHARAAVGAASLPLGGVGGGGDVVVELVRLEA